jgi:hypothetical protein
VPTSTDPAANRDYNLDVFAVRAQFDF